MPFSAQLSVYYWVHVITAQRKQRKEDVSMLSAIITNRSLRILILTLPSLSFCKRYWLFLCLSHNTVSLCYPPHADGIQTVCRQEVHKFMLINTEDFLKTVAECFLPVYCTQSTWFETQHFSFEKEWKSIPLEQISQTQGCFNPAFKFLSFCLFLCHVCSVTTFLYRGIFQGRNENADPLEH